MKLRLASPRTLIDLGTVPGLRGVRMDGNTLVSRRLTVHTDVASAELVQKPLPGLRRGIGDRRCAGAQSRHHRRKYRPRRSGADFS
jgi:carbon-monoxide dehydrogenase medium subunit